MQISKKFTGDYLIQMDGHRLELERWLGSLKVVVM
jgi:hypothetical protein